MNAAIFPIDDRNIVVLGGIINFEEKRHLDESDKVFLIEFDYHDSSFMQTLSEPISAIYQPF